VARCKRCYGEKQRIVRLTKPYQRRSQIRGNAIKRGIEWNLTKGQFIAFWKQPCGYCGGAIASIGLDRIDNSRGYEIGNIVSCCGLCNRMKSDMSRDEFLDHCATITECANAARACGGR